MTPGFTLGSKLNKSLGGGFTLGKKNMRLLAVNHAGFEIQVLTGEGWKVVEDGFPTRESAVIVMESKYHTEKFEYRVYESLK